MGIKTIIRFDKTEQQIASIRKLYPSIPILVTDDGHMDESDRYKHMKNVHYYYMGFDRGISAGRNALVSLAKSEFIVLMDDDMIWESSFSLNVAIHRLIITKASILTFGLSDRGPYMGHLFKDDDILHLCLFDSHKKLSFRVNEFPQCYRSDIGLNLMVAKRSFLIEHPWPEQYKLGEHPIYFWMLKQRSRGSVVACPDMVIKHNNRNVANYTAEYKQLRKRAPTFQRHMGHVLKVHGSYDKQCDNLYRAERNVKG